jgi:hypothetical protein
VRPTRQLGLVATATRRLRPRLPLPPNGGRPSQQTTAPSPRNPPPTYPLLDLLSISSMTGTHRHETEQHGSETQAAVPKVVVPSSQKKVRTVRSRSARR